MSGIVVTLVMSVVSCVSGHDGAVPDNAQIKSRMLAAMKRSEKALENYSCLVHDGSDELRDDGSVKKHESSVKEQFYVNGVAIEHILERNGVALNVSEAKREQQKVDKEVKKYSDPREVEKQQTRNEKQADIFLRALKLTDGRRTLVNGRSTLEYKLSGDPQFRPKKLEERFAQALVGYIKLDEETATPLEMRMETTRDVKIGGGMLANLHKGFWLHLKQQRQPDGVWITEKVDGSGDARAALFVHARFRFSEELDKCHLFSVQTDQKIQKTEARPPEAPRED